MIIQAITKKMIKKWKSKAQKKTKLKAIGLFLQLKKSLLKNCKIFSPNKQSKKNSKKKNNHRK